MSKVQAAILSFALSILWILISPYDLMLIDIVQFIILIVVSYLYFKLFKIHHYTINGLTGYFLFSMVVMPLVGSYDKMFLDFVKNFSFIVMLGVFSAASICNYFLRNKSEEYTNFDTAEIYLSNKKWAVVYFAVCFILSWISYSLNITQMGTERPVYPYKIEPMLNLTRDIILPVGMFLFFTAQRDRQGKLFIFMLNMLWLVYEMYIRGSRGILTVGLLPYVLWLFMLPGVSSRIKVRALTIFSILSIGAFYIGEYIRRTLNTNQDFILLKFDYILSRFFAEIETLKKIFTAEGILPSGLGISKMKEYGGWVQYHTVVLDQANTKIQSSGMTALLDGYLTFGYLGSISVVFLLFLFAYLNDVKSKFVGSKYKFIYIFNLIFLIKLTIIADGLISLIVFRSPLTWMVYPVTIMMCIAALRFLDLRLSKK